LLGKLQKIQRATFSPHLVGAYTLRATIRPLANEMAKRLIDDHDQQKIYVEDIHAITLVSTLLDVLSTHCKMSFLAFTRGDSPWADSWDGKLAPLD